MPLAAVGSPATEMRTGPIHWKRTMITSSRLERAGNDWCMPASKRDSSVAFWFLSNSSCLSCESRRSLSFCSSSWSDILQSTAGRWRSANWMRWDTRRRPLRKAGTVAAVGRDGPRLAVWAPKSFLVLVITVYHSILSLPLLTRRSASSSRRPHPSSRASPLLPPCRPRKRSRKSSVTYTETVRNADPAAAKRLGLQVRAIVQRDRF